MKSYKKDLLTVKQTEFKLEAGRILISTPHYNDAFFNRSVVLLTDYDKESCAGLIINRQLEYRVDQLVDGLRVRDQIFLGGPVQPSALFLLHNFENCPEASCIVPDVYVGYSQTLLALIEHQAISTMRYKFLMGYAGWSPGQLEREIANNMWVIGSPTPDLIFNTPAKEIWSKSVRILGKEYEEWFRIPKYINLN